MDASAPPQHDRTGLAAAFGAYVIWGFLPLYLILVRSVPAFEFVGWRIIWTLPLCLLIVLARKQWPDLRTALRNRRTVAWLAASATLIAINWVVYVWAIQNGQVYAASLGYYINPLVNVLLGTLLLGEKLTRAQIVIPTGQRLGGKVIDVAGLSKHMGDKLLIEKLDFSLPPGAIVGVIGPNGAGKSTLFNRLTNANVYADDKLFATLDSTIRRVILPAAGEAVIADTVGFIRDLPHELVEAFKSTLEETRQANVLLHVVDASDANNRDKIEQVEGIIEQIDAQNIPSIIVMNKIDEIGDFSPRVDKDNDGNIYRVWLSAHSGEGIDLIYKALSQSLSGMMTCARIQLDVQSAFIRSEIHKVGFIKKEKMNEFGQWLLEINVTRHYLERLLVKQGVSLLWEQKSQQSQTA